MFKQCFGPLSMVTVDLCSDTEFFGHLSNSAFSSLQFFSKKSPVRFKFFLKVFPILCRIRKCRKKLGKYFQILRQLHLNWLRYTLTFSERKYYSLGVNMLKNSLKTSDTSKKKLFAADFLSERSKTITQMLPCGFKQCFGPFNMLIVHKCSDTGFFGI